MKLHYITRQITLKVGAIGLVGHQITIPKDWPHLVGFYPIKLDDGGQPNYKIGLRRNNERTFEPIHNKVFEAANTSFMQKFMPMNHVVQDSDVFQVLFQFPAATNATFTVDVVFLATNDPSNGNPLFPLATKNAQDLSQQIAEESPY